MKVEKRIEELGIEMPKPPRPMGAYVPYAVAGSLVHIAGEKATVQDKLAYKGKVGKELSLKEGYEAARIAGLRTEKLSVHAITPLKCRGKIRETV